MLNSFKNGENPSYTTCLYQRTESDEHGTTLHGTTDLTQIDAAVIKYFQVTLCTSEPPAWAGLRLLLPGTSETLTLQFSKSNIIIKHAGKSC